MGAATRSSASQVEVSEKPKHNRLILCFDGTGNQFSGTPADTNIVKLYTMMDRGAENQMHYYQPGIGTYPAEGPVNVSFVRRIFRKFEAVIDQALATSFDSHVIAGYKFLMRYYKPGDKIYVFGFSRGAFTARFLSRMISHIGLLSMGNEELVPFAYKVYQDYEQNRPSLKSDPNKQEDFMNSFKKHFCRTLPKNETMSDNESGIKVHFLGLFDCVSSVGNLDVPFFKQTPPLPAVKGTAKYVRHAVAIDERRVKFKAALFSQEWSKIEGEDIKEVFFPGNHGDIGGGWDPETTKKHAVSCPRVITNDDHFQLSDIALKWMVDEVDDVENKENDLVERIKWDTNEKASFLKRFHDHKDEMIGARMHDTMKFGGGSKPYIAILWNVMEFIPFVIKRWEFVKRKETWVWEYIGFPTNAGGRRDIPSTALFHQSVKSRMELAAAGKKSSSGTYEPSNPLWVVSNSPKSKERNVEGLPIEATNLIKLAPKAETTKLTNGHRDSATQNLLKFRFKYEEGLSTGSVPITDKKILVGPQDWDNIYSVEMTSS